MSLDALRAQIMANIAVLESQLVLQRAAAATQTNSLPARPPAEPGTGQIIDKSA